jgi:glycosyltransferase involved in cell wall biosynthesis
MFSPAAEASIAAMRAPDPGEIPDAVYRIAYPYNISPSIGKRTVVFGTAEFRCVPDESITGNRSLASACNNCDALIVTPSSWSREGFIHSGADPDLVKVVPHGVDTSIFHPIDPSVREGRRREQNWSGFVFLTLGAMTENKGIEVMLRALAIVAQKHPHVRLVMKGMSALYPSMGMLKHQSGRLTQKELSIVQPRLGYMENTVNFATMARLYQSADAYLSPYLAEGFNLPVLEAIASGLPVICTHGGSTDDFTTDDFALRVNATLKPMQDGPTASGFFLDVDLDHLIHQMLTAVESDTFAAKGRIAGPAFVASGYTWQQVVGRLMAVLFD